METQLCREKCYHSEVVLQVVLHINMYSVQFYIHYINNMPYLLSHSSRTRFLIRKNCIGTHCKWCWVDQHCKLCKLRIFSHQLFPPLLIKVGVVLAPGDPLPDLGEALRELGGEERVGVDRRQLREQTQFVSNLVPPASPLPLTP